MKKITLILFFLSTLASGQSSKTDSIYFNPEVPAKFIYGEEELNSFISANVLLPYWAMYYGINGQVELNLVIDQFGYIKEIKIIKETDDPGVVPVTALVINDNNVNMNALYSNEVERVVQLLSGFFEPATYKGNEVVSSLTLALNFTTPQYKKNQSDYQQQLAADQQSWNFGTYKGTYNVARDTLLYNYGVIRMNDNKADLSSIYFEEATKLNPEYIDAYYNLGVVNYNLGMNSKACEAWEKAEALGDTEVPVLLEMYCY